MPRFSYQVRESSGAISAGVLQAGDVNEASRLLRREGKLIVALGPEQAQAGPAAPRPTRIRRDDVIYFATQLAVMVDTGVPLPEALDSIVQQCEHPGLKIVVADISEQVKGGQPFSQALEPHAKVFGPLFIALMRASEASGTMGSMLQRVSEYLEEERDTRKRVKGAMVYPVCMLSFCVLVILALMIFILPRFENIYKTKNAVLPAPTAILLGISKGIVDYWMVVLAGVVAVVGALVWYFRSSGGRILLDKIRLNMPVLGPMYRKACLARSLRTMATMVSTGVSMLDGLAITADVAGNHFYRKIWDDLAERVKEGGAIADHLMQCDLIPPTVAQMVGAGERTGRLGLVMNRIARFCEEDLKTSIKTVTSMIEPAMIIIMGLIVGGIAVALLMPVFSLSRVVAH